MRGLQSILVGFLLILLSATYVHAKATKTEKEWTFLVFINGHNNLSPFADMNIADMEKVGTTDQLNVVVEWGSESSNITKRILINKTGADHVVKSQVLAEMPDHDMGDYHNLVSFIDWGVKNFPAKHYFIAVWNHGSGWHRSNLFKPMDISYDDSSGNHITTEQLGLALTEAKKIIGKNVDVYGSDACLMQMLEVNGELKGSVDYVVGSQETEPGEGWPYEPLLRKWAAQPTISPEQVAVLLSKEYKAAYNGGVYGKKSDTTFSVVNMSKMDDMYMPINALGKSILALNAAQLKQVKTAIGQSTSFTYSDYVDLGDFVKNVKKLSFSKQLNGLADIDTNLKKYVVATDNNSGFPKATGLSIWLPTYSTSDLERYNNLKSSQVTGWNTVVKAILQAH